MCRLVIQHHAHRLFPFSDSRSAGVELAGVRRADERRRRAVSSSERAVGRARCHDEEQHATRFSIWRSAPESCNRRKPVTLLRQLGRPAERRSACDCRAAGGLFEDARIKSWTDVDGFPYSPVRYAGGRRARLRAAKSRRSGRSIEARQRRKLSTSEETSCQRRARCRGEVSSGTISTCAAVEYVQRPARR